MTKVFIRLALAAIVVAVCSLGLSACVTTSSGGGAQVNEKKALETHLRTGMAYLQRDNRDAARRHFNKALELDRRSAEAWQGLAILHQLNGEMDYAESRFKKALRGRSSISESSTHLAYGRFLYDQERYREALKHFDEAASDINYPSRATAFVYVGRAAQKLEKPDRAKAALEHALNLDKRQTEAMLELAAIYFSERDYARAQAYLERFSQFTKHTPRSLWLGIRIERVFGNKDKEASYVLALKNIYPYSKEYLAYKRLIEQ